MASTDALAVLFEAGAHSAYETISFASFEWVPPLPNPAQHWTHADDKTLRTDAGHCLDWTIRGQGSHLIGSLLAFELSWLWVSFH